MAIFKLVLTVMFLLGKGVSGCSLVDLDVPVVPFCQNHQRSGRSIVIDSDSVPQNQIVTCECDVRVAGTRKLITTYESPDYLNCGVELQLGDNVYSCADSKKYINVDETFNIVYRKTITRENPSMCIMFQSEPETSEIKVYCKKNEEQPATVKTTRKETNALTTKHETNTTLTTSRTGNSTPSHETNTTLTTSRTGNSTPSHETNTTLTTSRTGNSTPSHETNTTLTTSRTGNSTPSHETNTTLTTSRPGNSTPSHETNTTLTTSRTGNSTPSHETISSFIYKTSNATSVQQTSPSLSANVTIRTSVATTFPLSSYSGTIDNTTLRASIASSVPSHLPIHTTLKSSVLVTTPSPQSFKTTDQSTNSSTSYLVSKTTNESKITLNNTSPSKLSTSGPLKTDQFPSSTNQPSTVLITERTRIPEDRATSVSRMNTGSLELTQRRYSTSESHGSTSKSPPASVTEDINATFANSGQTIENNQWKKVVIICSTAGSVLLLIIAVALSILVYRYRMTRTKKTLETLNQQSYIDAFDSENGPGKSEVASLNRLVPIENINEPPKKLYSIPRELHHNKVKQNHQRFNEDNKQSAESKNLEVSHRNDGGIIQGSITRNTLRASNMDNDYDHSDNREIDTIERSSVEQWSDYDHVNAQLKDNVVEEPSNMSGWIASDESGVLSASVSPNPQVEWPAHYSYKTDGQVKSSASLTERQAGSELYTIVRKPREIYLQKKRTKLVSFKGYEDDEEEYDHKPKGILKHKSTEAHPIQERHEQDNQETIYDSTHIPRVKLDSTYMYMYAPFSEVNRSDEEKVLQNN